MKYVKDVKSMPSSRDLNEFLCNIVGLIHDNTCTIIILVTIVSMTIVFLIKM